VPLLYVQHLNPFLRSQVLDLYRKIELLGITCRDAESVRAAETISLLADSAKLPTLAQSVVAAVCKFNPMLGSMSSSGGGYMELSLSANRSLLLEAITETCWFSRQHCRRLHILYDLSQLLQRPVAELKRAAQSNVLSLLSLLLQEALQHRAANIDASLETLSIVPAGTTAPALLVEDSLSVFASNLPHDVQNDESRSLRSTDDDKGKWRPKHANSFFFDDDEEVALAASSDSEGGSFARLTARARPNKQVIVPPASHAPSSITTVVSYLGLLKKAWKYIP
jgi:hypothetical protein